MPRGTIQTEPVRKDLKTLPPDGFVLIRPLSFGQMLERRDMASKMYMEQTRRGRGNDRMNIETMMQASRQYEFAHCIVEHNIEDENGQQLNFNNPLALTVLDPRVGAEIEKFLDEINREDEEDDVVGFNGQSSSSLMDTARTPEDSSQTKNS